MPIEFRCTQCGRLLRTPDETAGKRAKCPECGAILAIPAPGAVPQPPPPAQPPSGAGPGGGFTTPQPGPAPPGGPAPPSGPSPGSPFAPGAPVNPYQSPVTSPFGGPGPLAAAAGFRPTRIDFGDVFGRTWRIFTDHWPTCLLALVIVMALSMGALGLLILAAALAAAASNDPAITVAIFSLGMVACFVFNLWLGIGQTHFFLKVARDGQAPLGELFAGRPYLGRVFLASILFMLIVVAGTILCYVPGIIFGLMFSQFFFLIVDRDVGVMESLRLSNEITNGNKLMLFAIQLVAQIGAQFVFYATCGLGLLAAAPFLALLNAVIYLAMTGQPTADRIPMAPPPQYGPPPGPTV